MTPLFHGDALRSAFKEPPDKFRELPEFYVNHLKTLFKDPKKLKLALTDVTPLTIIGLLTAAPAIAGLAAAMPHRRVQTLTGGLGNLLGGQLMQRTGITGGILGAVAGEALGRAVGSPFDRRQPPDVSDALSGALATQVGRARRVTGGLDDLLARTETKLGADETPSSLDNIVLLLKVSRVKRAMEHQGIREPNPTTHDASIGGSNPRLLDVPGQYGDRRRSVPGYGKTRPDIDTLNQGIMLANPTPSIMAKDHATDNTTGYNQMDGLHHDPMPMYERAQSIAGIGGVPFKRIKDRNLPET